MCGSKSTSQQLVLVAPSVAYLPGYVDALERGWSPDNLRDDVRFENLRAIQDNASAFIDSLDDPGANGGPINLPDGSIVNRLPSFSRWMWDGEFCGEIGFRWQPGTPDLPPTCPGHIGYSVVPWKRRRGYATAALGLLLPEAAAQGLPYVMVTTHPENVPSQRTILANGGVLVERFKMDRAFGDREAWRYKIELERYAPRS